MMSQRAVQIGGVHIHKLFGIPVNKKLSLHLLAKTAVSYLLRHPTKLHFLRELNILFVDEIGQISAEMLSLLSLILQYIQGNKIFMGGLLLICTLDHKQLQPVEGYPFLVSSHIISCFRFIVLQHSVRASGDISFQRLQNIAQMHPTKYEQDPSILIDFQNILRHKCTFVNDWNDPQITPSVFRLYGKKLPAKESSNDYINNVKQQLNTDEYFERRSEDTQKPHDSHQAWSIATTSTEIILDNRLKEQKSILFFKGALHQFTYNKDGKFSQSQLGLLLKLPDERCIEQFKKIEILVAPPGLKWTLYDPNKLESDYINEGWIKEYVGTAPERNHRISSFYQARRRQYGLKHHVTSTIHASMGDTLPKIATQISNRHSHFKLWDKAQVIVLMSRTRHVKDIIFVGDKEITIKSLTILLKTSSQWTNYMEKILSMTCVNHYEYDPILPMDPHPFRFCDRPLPNCNTGVVYMLISIKNHNYSYIGMTMNIKNRLNQHNSGNGSSYTTSLNLRPWALFAYIVGFDGDRRTMFYIEQRWKLRRQQEIDRGMNNPKEIARLGYGLIDSVQESNYQFNSMDLRLILNFID